MKKLMNTFMLFCSLFAFSGCSDEAQLLPAAKGEQGWYVNPYLDDLWVKVKANEAGLDIWDICQFVLEASDLGWDQKYLKVALTNLTDAQIRTEGHHNYGQIPRYIGGDTETTSFDKNNAEFLMELLSLERMLYYDRLDDANKALLDDLIDYSVYAILDDPNIAVTYTNIYVMRAWNLIALGETLPADRTWGRSMNVRPEELAGEGYRLFRDWMAEIRKNGIHEHNSPTYTGVQAECLGYLAKYTKDEAIRHEANVALEYLSAMAFANYFTPAMMLGGVQSRCYYKGSSNGKIDNIMGGLIKGWGTYFFNRLAMWTPTEQARRINATYPRLVCYKWGWDPDMNAVGYYTEKYNISSVGRTYTGNANEKTMTIFLSSPRQKTLVNIVHYFDGRQDPYGKNYINGLAVTCRNMLSDVRSVTTSSWRWSRATVRSAATPRSSSRTSCCRRTTSTRCGSGTKSSTNGCRSATRRFPRATTTRSSCVSTTWWFRSAISMPWTSTASKPLRGSTLTPTARRSSLPATPCASRRTFRREPRTSGPAAPWRCGGGPTTASPPTNSSRPCAKRSSPPRAR